MSSHYSNDRNWSQALLDDAQEWVSRLRIALSMMEVAPTQAVISEVTFALSQNLDTPKALESIKIWIKECEAGSRGGEAGELSRALDALLGLTL
jgi:L-cysteine:1D-myo-inositol 2-amino-2-deoxy-alpha-D-glucopyranoside ligase